MKPAKYILGITLVLFVLAFAFTLPGLINSKDPENPNNITSTEETASGTVSEELPAGGEPEMTNLTDSNGNFIIDGNITIPQTDSTSHTGDISQSGGTEYQTDASTNTNTAKIPSGNSNSEADNEWALFLVNHDNALPEDYKFETAVVYTGSNGKEFLMDSRAAQYMLQMIEDAQAYGAPIGITSAYRSVEYQKQNFDNNVKQLENQGMTHEEAYNETAKNIAIPGKSEHNTGLAADILSGEHWSLDEGFENTRAFKWLSENAHKYGFILRYPKDKTAITKINYEPWHYRFVGIYHATKIWESGLSLEEYMETLQ